MEKNRSLGVFSGVRYIMSFAKGYRAQFLLFFIGWFIIAICEVIVPVVFSIMINQIIYYKNLSLFLQISGLFIILTGFNAGMYFLIYQVYAYLSNMYTYQVRHGLFKQMQRLDTEIMVNSNYGDISIMIQWHAQVCMDFLVRNIIHSFNHVFKILFCVVIIVNISPYLALIMMVLIPIVVFINVKFGQRIRKVNDEQRKRYGDYIGWIFEVIQGFRDIRLLGASRHVLDKFKKNQGDIIETENKSKFYILSANNIIQFANTLFLLIIFVVLALLTFKSNIRIGAVIITCSYYEIIRKNMNTLRAFKLTSVSKYYLSPGDPKLPPPVPSGNVICPLNIYRFKINKFLAAILALITHPK